MHVSKEIMAEARLMRRDIKKRYKNEIKGLKEKYRAELYGFYDSCGIPRPCDPPRRSALEESGNSISHGLGAVMALVALFVMLTHSVSRAQRVGAVVYFLGLFVMFTSSCLYHAFRHGTAVKRLFRRFDYASVYILIGATFCPILLNLSKEGSGVSALLIFQWAVIFIGAAAAVVLGPARFVYPHITMYLILGWSALFILPTVMRSGFGFFCFILCGGLMYTLGVIPCAVDKHASHFVWHIFVLAGAAIQCVGVLNFIYLQ